MVNCIYCVIWLYDWLEWVEEWFELVMCDLLDVDEWKTEESDEFDKEEKQQRSIKKVALAGKTNSEINANPANACNKAWKNIDDIKYLINNLAN